MTKKILVIPIVFFLILGGFIVLNVDGDNFHKFRLLPLSIHDESTAITDRICYFKVFNSANVGGQQFDSDNSPFLKDHPQLILNFLAGDAVNQINSFTIEPRLKCFGLDASTGGTLEERIANQQAIIDACFVDPLELGCETTEEAYVVQSGQLSIQVISENKPSDTKIVTFSKTFDTDRKELFFNSEVTLASFVINSEDIFNDLDVGTYNSFQEFRVFGELEIRLLDFEGSTGVPSWTYFIPEQAVPTFHQVIVVKESMSEATEAQEEALKKQEEDNKTIGESGLDQIGLFSEFGDCLILNDTECLNQGKFVNIWLLLVGLGGFLVLAIIASIIFKGRSNNG